MGRAQTVDTDGSASVGWARVLRSAQSPQLLPCRAGESCQHCRGPDRGPFWHKPGSWGQGRLELSRAGLCPAHSAVCTQGWRWPEGTGGGGWLSENQVRLLMLPCDLQAKLGNSSVSPNVGHLVLKYLCPAVQAVLEDGLKAFVLDVIIGQRKNTPWSVVEASTQLGRGRTATLGSRLNSEFQRLEMDLQPNLSPSQAHPPRSCMVSTTKSASSQNLPATLCASMPSSSACSSKCVGRRV